MTSNNLPLYTPIRQNLQPLSNLVYTLKSLPSKSLILSALHYRLMTFKVIIRRPNVEDDENAYHGIVFLNPNKVHTKRLKYVASENILKATFTFDGNPIKVGDKFLACLVAVDGGVEIENATFKIQKNSPQNKPEVVDF